MEFLSWHLNLDLAVAALWTAAYHKYRSFIAGCLKIGRGEIYIDLYINIVGHTYLRAGRRYKAGELFPLLRSLLWKHFHRPNNTEWRVCISHNATTLPPTHTHTHTTHKHTCRPANFCLHIDIKKDIWKYGIRFSLEKMTQAYAFIYVAYAVGESISTFFSNTYLLIYSLYV